MITGKFKVNISSHMDLSDRLEIDLLIGNTAPFLQNILELVIDFIRIGVFRQQNICENRTRFPSSG